jgi:tetratricopeptide (TPR) repeat protein
MVLSLCADEFDAWEATLFNLGHACRKLQLYDEAIGHYYKALNISPRNPSIYTALGFAHHLRSRPEDLHKAIDYYHQALGITWGSLFVPPSPDMGSPQSRRPPAHIPMGLWVPQHGGQDSRQSIAERRHQVRGYVRDSHATHSL